ncbi:MAG: glucosamine-6-phosphate deaminase [Pisciglobus halotolerans]|nr:glucosamine-6-phosphate deaminase [Pisciglobus halotolerans]
MEVIVKKTAEEASEKAFKLITEDIKKGAKVLGLATGSTPEKLYDLMTSSDQDYSDMISVNLDEYVGLSAEDPQSYSYFMQKHLFDKKPFKETHIPDGMADSGKETARYETVLKENPVDVQILGLGTNGHIGFNEPGTSFDSITHKVDLVQSTIDSNKRYFENEEDVPKTAYSMGIESIMRAEKIILMAFGKNKAEAVKGLVEGPVTEELPASILQEHPDAIILLDEDAASLLK